MALVPRLDGRAVALGTGVALALAVPAALGAQVIDTVADLDEDSNWVFAFLILILAGFVLGGLVAGRRRPEAPLAHGAVAALAAFVLIQGIGTLRRLVAGDSVSWVQIVFNALLASSAGIVGGLLASRRRTASR